MRRASAKCLESIVSSRPELLSGFYDTISLPLVRRFKVGLQQVFRYVEILTVRSLKWIFINLQEREESVKVDIFAAFIALVKHTCAVASNAPGQNQLAAVTGETAQPMDVEDSSIAKLLEQVPVIIKCKLPKFILILDIVCFYY